MSHFVGKPTKISKKKKKILDTWQTWVKIRNVKMIKYTNFKKQNQNSLLRY